jgi:hypothetical protein
MDTVRFKSPDATTDSDVEEDITKVGKAIAGTKLGDKTQRGMTRLS